MDALSGLFRGPRAEDAFVLRMVMSPPWSVAVLDEAPLTLVAVVSGSVVVRPTAGAVRSLEPGQVAIVRGPDHYRLGHDAEEEPQILVHPGQRCEDRSGRSLEEPLMQGVRTWGNDPDGSTVVLVGTYEGIGDPGHTWLGVLPPVLVVDGDELGSPIVELLAAELARDVPGQEVVLDRLLDLLTVATLRAWFDRPEVEAPAWWRAAADPVVGPALRLMEHQPAHPWTVGSLAAEVGVSRATLSRRFSDLVGRPPMAHLTEWRISLAADLLADPDLTVDAVAGRVGYGTGFALSEAFLRVRGRRPSEVRLAASSS